jgi:hypothetical protein
MVVSVAGTNQRAVQILVDGWKMWELNAGFNLGLLYVVALYWATRRVDKVHHPNGAPLLAATEAALPPDVLDRRRNISLALAVPCGYSLGSTALPTMRGACSAFTRRVSWTNTRGRRRA